MDDEEPFGFLPVEDQGESDEDLFGPYVPPGVLPVTPPLTANRIPSRYRRSAGASVLAAGMLGIRDIIDPPKDDRPVVEQHSDDDDLDRPIEVYLDPDDPSASLVVIRNPADDN